MYTRDLKPKIARAVSGGQCNFGNFAAHFDSVNLVDARNPFFFPLPRFIKQWRLKEWETLHVFGPDAFLSCALCNGKSYSMAQIVVKEAGAEPLVYRRTLPFSRCKLSRNLRDSHATYRTRALKIDIHNHLSADEVLLEAAARDFRALPALAISLRGDHSFAKAPPLVSCMPLGPNRAAYSHRALLPASGQVLLGDRRIEFPAGKSLALFCDQKGHYPYRMRLDWVGAAGYDGKGRPFGFSLSGASSKGPEKINECALWLDGRLHLLPPVRITRPGGPDKPWFIQDYEGMVDLTFTPRAPNSVEINFLAIALELRGPMGTFDGFVMAADGEKIALEKLPGAGECCAIAL